MSTKVVVVGDAVAWGESSLKSILLSLIQHDEPIVHDGGYKSMSNNFTWGNLELWDTTGQEDFASLRQNAYPDTDCFVLVWDLQKPETLEDILEVWVPDIEQTEDWMSDSLLHDEAVYILVGLGEHQMTESAAQAAAQAAKELADSGRKVLRCEVVVSAGEHTGLDRLRGYLTKLASGDVDAELEDSAAEQVQWLVGQKTFFEKINKLAEGCPELPPAETSALLMEAADLFRSLDASGDGFLQGAELTELAQWMLARTAPGAPPSSKRLRMEASRLLAVMDANRDSKISLEEFENYVNIVAPAMIRVLLKKQRMKEGPVGTAGFCNQLRQDAEMIRRKVEAWLSAHADEKVLAEQAIASAQARFHEHNDTY